MKFDILPILKEHKIECKSVYGTDEKIFVCPVCGKDDHFYFNIKKNVGICHRCKWEANAVAFLMAVLNLDRGAALELCTDHKDTSAGGLRGKVRGLLDEQEESFENLEMYEVFFKNPLPKNIEDVTSKKFPKAFVERGVKYEDIKSLNVKICNSSGRYFNRIIVPVKTLKTETFTAVTSLTREKFKRARKSYAAIGIKYRKSIFPSKSFISEVIYQYDIYKNSDKPLFIVEGFWDFLKLKKLALNVNCVLGSSISHRQAYLFSKVKSDRLYLMLDGDVSFKYLKKIHSLLSETCFDKQVKACILPGGKDPDEASLNEIKASIVDSRTFLF